MKARLVRGFLIFLAVSAVGIASFLTEKVLEKNRYLNKKNTKLINDIEDVSDDYKELVKESKGILDSTSEKDLKDGSLLVELEGYLKNYKPKDPVKYSVYGEKGMSCFET